MRRAREIACGLGIALLATSAYADDKPTRATIGNAIGWCSRSDLNVGATGVCGEPLLVGFDYRISRVFRFAGETGIGALVHSDTGAPGTPTGIEYAAGGWYAPLRLMLHVNLAHDERTDLPLFFLTFGAEGRFVFSGWPILPGVAGFAALGGRVGRHFEIGARVYIGADAVNDGGSVDLSAIAIGSLLFTRWIL